MKMETIGNVGFEVTKSERNREKSNLRNAAPRNSRFGKEKPARHNMEHRGSEAALSMRCRAGLPGIEVEKRFRSAARTLQRSEAAAAFYLAEIDERRLWLELGYSSVIAYAAEASDIAAKKAYALLNIGRRLRELPVIRAAFDEGRIGWTKVRDILRLRGDIDEEEMLERARTSTSRELERFVSNSNGAANRNKWKSIHRLEENQAGIFDQLENSGPGRKTLSQAELAAAAAYSQAGRLCSSPASEASGLSTEKKKPVRHDGPGSKVSVTLKFTMEEYAIYIEAKRVWKRKNRSSWKQERMVVAHARRYLEEVAVEGDNKGVLVTGAFSEATTSRSNEQVGPAVARNGGKETVPTPEPDSTSAKSSAVNGKTAQPWEIPTQATEANSRNGSGPVIVDSPYNIYIHHCPECGKNSMTGKHGDRIGVDESLFGKALCDGAVHTAGKRGVSSRKKRSVSPALRKKIFMRDGGVCRVPGCGKTSSLEVHHVRPLSAGGGNDPANLLLCCSLCHSNIHKGRLRVSGSYPEFEFQHIGRIGMINQRLRRAGG